MTNVLLVRIAVLSLATAAATGAFAFVWSITPQRPSTEATTAAVGPPAKADRRDLADRRDSPVRSPGSNPPPARTPGQAEKTVGALTAALGDPAGARPAPGGDQVPAFDIARIEATGEAVIAGRAAPGAVVELLRDGKVHDRAVADKAGEFVLVPPPLPPGTYGLTLRSTRPDGQKADSRESVAVALAPNKRERPVVALMAPDRPSLVLSKPSAPGAAPGAITIDAVETEAGGKLYVAGRSAAGAIVRLYLNDAYLAQATAAADGRIAFSIGGGVVPGDYRVRLDEVDAAAGTVKSRAEVPFNLPAAAMAWTQPSKDQPSRPRTGQSAPPALVPAAPGRSPAPTVLAGAPPSQVPSSQLPSSQAPSQASSQPPAPATSGAASPEPAATASTGTPPAVVVVPNVAITTVSPGDNLWRISRNNYGAGLRYSVIYAANQGQIRNPNRIYPGQVFVLPKPAP